ncbi:MAG: hypothetical protein HZA05_05890 [Nitrospirae bacterium]|nr:hypothetical protein [Nitrospirota bacterium]
MPKPQKHKRKKPKSGRAGCLLCKPHKRQGADRRTLQEKAQDEAEKISGKSELEGAYDKGLKLNKEVDRTGCFSNALAV